MASLAVLWAASAPWRPSCAMWWIPPSLRASFPTCWAPFSLTGVLTNFASNTLFDLSGLLLYLSLTALMLFLTVQMIQRRRWN